MVLRSVNVLGLSLPLHSETFSKLISPSMKQHIPAIQSKRYLLVGSNCYWCSCKLTPWEGNSECNTCLITFIRHELINTDEMRRSVTKLLNSWYQLYKMHVMSIVRLIHWSNIIRFNKLLWPCLCYNYSVVFYVFVVRG